jgi:hypothetical protein
MGSPGLNGPPLPKIYGYFSAAFGDEQIVVPITVVVHNARSELLEAHAISQNGAVAGLKRWPTQSFTRKNMNTIGGIGALPDQQVHFAILVPVHHIRRKNISPAFKTLLQNGGFIGLRVAENRVGLDCRCSESARRHPRNFQ